MPEPERRSSRWRPRFTLARLMIAVAMAAPFLLILRGDEQTEMFLGAVIITACVATLTYKLASDAIRRGESGGKSLKRWQKVGIVLISSMAALTIIVTADLAFFVSYELYVSMLYYFPARKSDVRYDLDIHILGLIEGTIAALGVTLGLRLLFWLLVSPKRSFERFRTVRKGSTIANSRDRTPPG